MGPDGYWIGLISGLALGAIGLAIRLRIYTKRSIHNRRVKKARLINKAHLLYIVSCPSNEEIIFQHHERTAQMKHRLI